MGVKHTVRIITYKVHSEHYFTLSGGLTKRALELFIRDLEEKKLRIVKITYLGDPSIFNRFRLGKYPTLEIGNSGMTSLKNASVCIHAVGGTVSKFKYIQLGKEVVGTYFAIKHFELLSIAGIAASRSKDFKEEAATVYKKLDRLLSRVDFSPKLIYRFWNYMDSISSNYADFNNVRDVYFKKHDITKYPAATGIEARLDSSIRIGFEAIKPLSQKAVITKIISSDKQSQAWSYGPKFSRAMLVEFPRDGVKKLYISGTSSVDKKGVSILIRNDNRNVRYVLSSVQHLLKKNRMSLRDILTSYVYCKNIKILKKFNELYAVNKWDFPFNPVITNICRDNLSFEIECLAASSKK